MADLPQDPLAALKTVLSEHLPWHGARIGFLAHVLPALLKVRSVSLAELATSFGGKAKVASHYKRLQRLFRAFEIDPEALARLSSSKWEHSGSAAEWMDGYVKLVHDG